MTQSYLARSLIWYFPICKEFFGDAKLGLTKAYKFFKDTQLSFNSAETHCFRAIEKTFYNDLFLTDHFQVLMHSEYLVGSGLELR